MSKPDNRPIDDMKLLTMTSAVLASAALVCLIEYRAQQQVRAKNRDLAEQLKVVETQLGQARGTLAKGQERWAERQTETRTTRAELQAVENEVQMTVPPEMDPAHEGMWPGNKPYFYLAKRRLKDVGYDAINGQDKLTTLGITLFNISKQERTGVDNAIQEFRKNLNELEVQHAERIEPAPGVNTEDHKEISFRLSGVTNELAQLKAQLRDSVKNAMGAERGGLLLERVNVWVEDQNGSTGGEEATISLEANRYKDGDVHHLFHYKQERGGSGTMGLNYPLHAWDAVWRYRHLFGEEPLIPLPAKKK
jgi:hypothetical protein